MNEDIYRINLLDALSTVTKEFKLYPTVFGKDCCKEILLNRDTFQQIDLTLKGIEEKMSK